MLALFVDKSKPGHEKFANRIAYSVSYAQNKEGLFSIFFFFVHSQWYAGQAETLRIVMPKNHNLLMQLILFNYSTNSGIYKCIRLCNNYKSKRLN